MIYILLVVVPIVLLTVGVQLYVEYVFGKWSRINNAAGINGSQVAERLCRDTGLRAAISRTNTENGDHYDPGSHTVRLSEGVATGSSVQAMAVAAHELGHAQQYEQDIAMIRYRSLLVPAVRLSPTVAYALVLTGLTARFPSLLWVGFGAFCLSLVFMFLTLPIEFDASRRGIALLHRSGLLATQSDTRGVQHVLNAAALTYVAASALSLFQLFRYLRYLRR